MRTLTIGSTNLELNSFRKIRDKVVGVYAQIEIPATAISHDELKALFTDNQHDLIVTEEDGSTTTYSGYAQLDEIREKAGVYTVIQICTSEAIHLLNEARKQIEEQQGTITEMTGVIAAQDNELKTHARVISEQNDVIVAQGNTIAEQGNVIVEQGKSIEEQKATIEEQTVTIAEQTELVAVLEETSVMQMATLESLLLEVIPTVITETVTIAVEEALASNPTTETEVVE